MYPCLACIYNLDRWYGGYRISACGPASDGRLQYASDARGKPGAFCRQTCAKGKRDSKDTVSDLYFTDCDRNCTLYTGRYACV